MGNHRPLALLLRVRVPRQLTLEPVDLVDQRLLIGSTGHAEDRHEYRAEAKARTARDYIKDNHAARSVSVMNEETWISDVVTVPRRHDPKSEQPPGTL